MLFCGQVILLKTNLFNNNKNQEYLKSVKVWTQIRPDILSGLIWVQTLCLSYQHTSVANKKLKLTVYYDMYTAQNI